LNKASEAEGLYRAEDLGDIGGKIGSEVIQ
jgi:hypothetical protein